MRIILQAWEEIGPGGMAPTSRVSSFFHFFPPLYNHYIWCCFVFFFFNSLSYVFFFLLFLFYIQKIYIYNGRKRPQTQISNHTKKHPLLVKAPQFRDKMVRSPALEQKPRETLVDHHEKFTIKLYEWL